MPVKTGISYEINQIFKFVNKVKLVPVNVFSKYIALFIACSFFQ